MKLKTKTSTGAFPPVGWPRLKWVVTDSKYLTKPSKDWQPHIPTANTDPAYIEVRKPRRRPPLYSSSRVQRTQTESLVHAS